MKNKLMKVFSRLNFYLMPPILRLKAAVDKNIDEKILTNGQLFIKFFNIFCCQNLCNTESYLYMYI